MNRLAARLAEAVENKEIINYYIEYQYVQIIRPARRFVDEDVNEQINEVPLDRMRQAVRQAGMNVAAHVLTIWS